MAGVISTATWVDGRYMDRSVNIDTVLEKHNAPEETKPEIERPPVYGLLTQKIVETPVVHWILPARLSNIQDHDVAFIGDRTVTIRRLIDGQYLHDVCRINDFGCRIRNARVIGSPNLESARPIDSIYSVQKKDEGGDVVMEEAQTAKSDTLGPQSLVLALESGDLIFIFAPDTGPGKFINPYLGRHVPHTRARFFLKDHPGRHISVDPSSRYMALAASENKFTIYALQSPETLSGQYARRQTLEPVASKRTFPCNGVILKMEFLYPAPDDPDHIILLVLAVKGGRTRMHVYDWEAGQDLFDSGMNSWRGLAIADEYRLPLLLIPLTIKSAFFLVCEKMIVVCDDLLTGNPTFKQIQIGVEPPTSVHYGRGSPLWTAWTRPPRNNRYSNTHDDIYLAREDGLVKYLENSMTNFGLSMTVATFEHNVGPSIASLVSNFPGRDESMADILLAAGDFSKGGMYLIRARKPAKLIGELPNWSPVLDIAIQNNDSTSNASETFTRQTIVKHQHKSPDRVFFCSGAAARGPLSAVSEIRQGIAAKVWQEIVELDVPIGATWRLPVDPQTQSGNDDPIISSSMILVAIGDQSMLLEMSGDDGLLKDVNDVSQDSTWLDLSSRTLVAAYGNGSILQITEHSIRFSNRRLLSTTDSLPPDCVYRQDCPQDETIVAAAIEGTEYALIAYRKDDGTMFLHRLHFFMVSALPMTMEASPSPHCKILGPAITLSQYPTCASIVRLNDRILLGIIGRGEIGDDQEVGNATGTATTSTLEVCVFTESESDFKAPSLKIICDTKDMDPIVPISLETCVSLMFLKNLPHEEHLPPILLIGYRNGLLLIVHIDISEIGMVTQQQVHPFMIGSTSVIISEDVSDSDSALVCCDSRLYKIGFDAARRNVPILTRVWIDQASTASHDQPAIDSVTSFGRHLLVTSSTQMIELVLESNKGSNIIPRQMQLRGIPNRLLYFGELNILIVTVFGRHRPKVLFLDPETGLNIGQRSGKDREDYFALDIGLPGTKIFVITPWKFPGLDETLLVLGTSGGDLVILQRPEFISGRTAHHPHDLTKVVEKHFDAPIVGAATKGTSLFCCLGRILVHMTLDSNFRSLKMISEYKLPSIGGPVTIQGSFINVATKKDSIVTLSLKNDGKLVLEAADTVSYYAMAQVPLEVNEDASAKPKYNMVLVSDEVCAVIGFRYKTDPQKMHQEHERVFEAHLPNSIVRFAMGKPRPTWDISWKNPISMGVVPMNPQSDDLLGIGIDGSIWHFTLLSEALLKLLKIIQDLALRSPLACPIFHNSRKPRGEDTGPMANHIDGEVLRRCMTMRLLETLLGLDGDDDAVNDSNEDAYRCCALVAMLRGDRDDHQRELSSPRAFVRELYEILATLLRPVI